MSEALTTFRRAVEGLEEALNELDTASLLGGPRIRERAELVSASLGHLAGDELDVIGFVIDRLQTGRLRYGALDVAADLRDFKREAAEEAADHLVYAAAQAIREAAPISASSTLAGRELGAYWLGRSVGRAESKRRSFFRRFLAWTGR